MEDDLYVERVLSFSGMRHHSHWEISGSHMPIAVD